MGNGVAVTDIGEAFFNFTDLPCLMIEIGIDGLFQKPRPWTIRGFGESVQALRFIWGETKRNG